LVRQEIEDRLYQAAAEIGLEQDPGCGPRGIRATIQSGLEAGLADPRDLTFLDVPSGGTYSQNGAAPRDAVPETIIIRASEVKVRKVEWLWPGRIPLGKLTTFAGHGGLGKTFVLCDMTARITSGAAWPDQQEKTSPGLVLFISGEDDPEDTLVPRMIAMGADLEKVVFLKSDVQDRFTLADLPTLNKALEQAGPGVRFVAIDPPTAYLGDVDDHKNAELRALLTPLKNWTAKHQLSCVFNTHVNKQTSKVDALARVLGSVAWVNAVRAAHLFAKDPDEPLRRLFVPMKNNLGKEIQGLAYRIEEQGELAVVKWLGEVTTTADEAVNKLSAREGREVTASKWLIDRFKEKLEWCSEDLFKAAKHEHISKNALFEAKRMLQLPNAKQVVQQNGNREWIWWVPADWPPLKDEDTLSKNNPQCPDPNEISGQWDTDQESPF
jgi:hypothetical protein